MIARLLRIPAAIVAVTTAPVGVLAQVLAILGDPPEVEEDPVTGRRNPPLT